MNDTVSRIKKYKELKADIRDIELRIKELEGVIIGISTEKSIIGKEKLLEVKSAKEIEIARIDNAMTVLLDEEREIIQEAYIEHKKYWRIEDKLHLTYSRIKQIEKVAIEKMKKYIE